VIVVIGLLAFLLLFPIQTCAGAYCWNSTPLPAHMISSSILLGWGMLTSRRRTSRLSAILEPAVGSWPGIWLLLCTWGGTVSHLLAGVGADFGIGSCCTLGCSLSCSLGFSCGCSCCCLTGPPRCIVSARCVASSPSASIFAVLPLSFSLACWPGGTHFMTFATMVVMPAAHSLSSSWRVSHFYSLTCIQAIIATSSQAACTYCKFARCPMVRCSCVSSSAC